MATRFVLTPNAAEFPATNFPQLLQVNRRPVLAFDAATNESCMWTGVAPQGLSGTPHAFVHYVMASATTGDVDLDGSIEAITPGDAVDLDAGDSFDTANSADNNSVPATAGYEQVIDITLTNADSIAAGDYFRFSLTRDAASDTAAGDLYVLSVEIRDGA